MKNADLKGSAGPQSDSSVSSRFERHGEKNSKGRVVYCLHSRSGLSLVGSTALKCRERMKMTTTVDARRVAAGVGTRARALGTAVPPESPEFSGAVSLHRWTVCNCSAIRINIAAIMLAKRQQITFTGIVRLIIISRWQLMHYGAGPKRLTLFQIKIYNANPHLPVPARAGDIDLRNDSLPCSLLGLTSRERS